MSEKTNKTRRDKNLSCPGAEARPEPRPAKAVAVKQFLVLGPAGSAGRNSGTKAFFVLATCAVTARKEFEERTGMKAVQCCQAAESNFTKDDLVGRDFWKEGWNWEIRLDPGREMSESAKRYFDMKIRAEKVQVAKAKAGIESWDTATEKQLRDLDALLSGENTL